jgi:hypothetical protein
MDGKLMLALVAVSGLAFGGCDSRDDTYTLYRNSPVDPTMRLHVATFDAAEPNGYNQGNCAQAEKLFIAQPGVTAKFWCEKGRFKK